MTQVERNLFCFDIFGCFEVAALACWADWAGQQLPRTYLVNVSKNPGTLLFSYSKATLDRYKDNSLKIDV